MLPVNIGVVGIGGYGRTYMRVIETLEGEGVGCLYAAVIRNRPKYAQEAEVLEARGVRIRASLEEMLEKDAQQLGIVAIPTGIPMHRQQMIQSVEAGCDVLLEKPPTATIQDMDAMLAALERTGRWCQVGFQNQAKSTVRALKHLLGEGRLGCIQTVVVKGCWVRRDSYYERNPWAGRLRFQGEWVLDGTVNNPLAHYLMNALYFAQPEWGRIATPIRVRAELYHAHDIESEDTSAVEIETAEGTRIFFFATLCAEKHSDVLIEVVGDKGTALWPAKGDVEIRLTDGTTEKIPDPGDDCRVGIFRNALLYKAGKVAELDCPLAMTRSLVLAVNGVFKSAGPPRAIAPVYLNVYHDAQANSRAVEIKGISDWIARAFAERRLFSDLGVPWAYRTQFFTLDGFRSFDL